MKSLFIVILFLVGCSTNSVEKSVPEFDHNRAFQHLVDQCDLALEILDQLVIQSLVII